MTMLASLFLALLLPMSASGQSSSDSVHFNGACGYNASVAKRATDTTLILCTGASIVTGTQSTDFVFDLPMTGRVRYSGSLDGDQLIVDRVSREPGNSRASKGLCNIYRTNGRVSVISCLASFGSRFVAANFVVSRIN